MRLHSPPNIRAYNVVHVEPTSRGKSQPSDISASVPARSTLHAESSHQTVVGIVKILADRYGGTRFQFLAVLRGASSHEDVWDLSTHSIDFDGTMTEAFYKYFRVHNLFENLHNSLSIGELWTR